MRNTGRVIHFLIHHSSLQQMIHRYLSTGKQPINTTGNTVQYLRYKFSIWTMPSMNIAFPKSQLLTDAEELIEKLTVIFDKESLWGCGDIFLILISDVYWVIELIKITANLYLFCFY